MRASLLAGRREIEKARSDLDAVLQAIPTFHHPDKLRSAAAEAALHLGDLALAKRLVAEMSSGSEPFTVHHIVTLARIASLEKDFDTAEQRYRQAATIDPAHRLSFLAELGAGLFRAKKHEA